MRDEEFTFSVQFYEDHFIVHFRPCSLPRQSSSSTSLNTGTVVSSFTIVRRGFLFLQKEAALYAFNLRSTRRIISTCLHLDQHQTKVWVQLQRFEISSTNHHRRHANKGNQMKKDRLTDWVDFCIEFGCWRIVRNCTETKSNPFESKLFASENDTVKRNQPLPLSMGKFRFPSAGWEWFY